MINKKTYLVVLSIFLVGTSFSLVASNPLKDFYENKHFNICFEETSDFFRCNLEDQECNIYSYKIIKNILSARNFEYNFEYVVYPDDFMGPLQEGHIRESELNNGAIN